MKGPELPSCEKSGRQACETIQILHRVQELGYLWSGGYIVLKIDLARAFDQIYHSAVLSGLLSAQADPRFAHAIARELLHAKAYHFMQKQDLCGRVRMERGVRQGSPLSGLLFVVALTWGLPEC